METVEDLEKETKYYEQQIQKLLKVREKLDKKEKQLLKRNQQLLNEIDIVKSERELHERNIAQLGNANYKVIFKLEMMDKNTSK